MMSYLCVDLYELVGFLRQMSGFALVMTSAFEAEVLTSLNNIRNAILAVDATIMNRGRAIVTAIDELGLVIADSKQG